VGAPGDARHQRHPEHVTSCSPPSVSFVFKDLVLLAGIAAVMLALN
jgi:hypothetical protein